MWLRLGIGVAFDLGASLGNQRIIGDSRSIDGLVFWITSASIIAGLQGDALRGFYLGAGGFSGTVLNSFLKRRLGIGQGQGKFFLDYFDHTLGAGLMLCSAYKCEISVFFWAVVIYGALHWLIDRMIRARIEKPALQGVRIAK